MTQLFSDRMTLIRNVIQNLKAAASCLHFPEILAEDIDYTENYIKFTNDGDQWNANGGCWSYLGQQGGEQVLSKNILEYLAKYFIEIF